MDLSIGTYTNDLVFEEGDFQLTKVESDAEVAQRVQLRLLTRLNEWFLNQNAGLPYVQSYLGHKGNKTYVDTQILAKILATDDVAAVPEFRSELNKATRAYSVYCAVTTTYGSTIELNVAL